jgi:hypothetical protein
VAVIGLSVPLSETVAPAIGWPVWLRTRPETGNDLSVEKRKNARCWMPSVRVITNSRQVPFHSGSVCHGKV